MEKRQTFMNWQRHFTYMVTTIRGTNVDYRRLTIVMCIVKAIMRVQSIVFVVLSTCLYVLFVILSIM